MTVPPIPNSNQIDIISLINQKIEGHGSENFQSKTFQRNEYIYQPQQKVEHIFIVKEGRVKIGTSDNENREFIKRVIAKGDLFGTFSLLEHSPRNDYAVAMERTEVYQLSRTELLSLLNNQSDFNQFMIQLLGNHLLEMEQRLESVVFKNSRSRIIDFLDQLVKKRGQRVGYEMLVRKFFTHQEIANLTATSRQTVTTVLNELKNKNILIFNRRRLLIRDIELLRAEAA